MSKKHRFGGRRSYARPAQPKPTPAASPDCGPYANRSSGRSTPPTHPPQNRMAALLDGEPEGVPIPVRALVRSHQRREA